MVSSSSSSSSWVATDRNRVIGEVTRGREIADQLRAILREGGDNYDSTESAVMLGKILDSFTQSLDLLLSTGDQYSDEVPAVVNSPSRKSEDSKKPDRRGCYKRRRSSETSWTKETPTFFDDGYAWRKYGQKLILHAIHPRNYFRCTHKHDQGCKATKQVQKVEDDPRPLFRTTYHGHHTCSLLKSVSHHDIVPTPDDYSNATCIWSFQSHQPAIKQEKHQIQNIGSSQYAAATGGGSDYFISADQLATFDDDDDHNLAAAFSSVTDQGADVISSSDVYSCTASTHEVVDSVFDHHDFLQF